MRQIKKLASLHTCFFADARYFHETMFRKKANGIAVPFLVSVFRVLHCVLFCHAAAIIGVAFLRNGDPLATSEHLATPEHLFALAVATPMLLGSFFFWLAVTARVLFATGVFFCLLPALLLVMLPAMMNVFFPMHLYVFGFAAIYAVSGFILIRFFFAQPVPKKK